jgi:hypothetical protein
MELTFCIKMKSEGPKRAGIFFGSWQGGGGGHWGLMSRGENALKTFEMLKLHAFAALKN